MLLILPGRVNLRFGVEGFEQALRSFFLYCSDGRWISLVSLSHPDCGRHNAGSDGESKTRLGTSEEIQKCESA
jgi:hypothetical protein